MDRHRAHFSNYRPSNANIRIADETPCVDNLLLHFPFENSFDDVTCHGAVATMYGTGSVELVKDPVHGTVASFDGNAYLEVLYDKKFIRYEFSNKRAQYVLGQTEHIYTHYQCYSRDNLSKLTKSIKYCAQANNNIGHIAFIYTRKLSMKIILTQHPYGA